MTPVEEQPSPTPSESLPEGQEKERQLYSQVEEETNPFRWEFDLCNVTLGNFHYRKMSLVRDYTELLDKNDPHSAFDTIFSLEPREAPAEPPKPLPIEECYPIVNCDPTQASAIALARTGKHFIIQGPPGTGKSQTITNLIADFVSQGKRVLFVCEKRAAIDVVYQRLHHGRAARVVLFDPRRPRRQEGVHLRSQGNLRGVSGHKGGSGSARPKKSGPT